MNASEVARSSAAYRGLLGFLVGVSLLAALPHFHLMMFVDCDSPWHIAAGDLIRRLGYVPYDDPWAFTTSGQTWYNISWAYDVAVSLLRDAVGLDGVQLAVMTCLAALCTVLLYVCKQRGVGIFAAFIATCLGCFMAMPSVQVRPQLVSMLLLALCYLHLHAACVRGTRRHLWCIPLYAVVWVNVHGGFLALYVLMGAYGLQALVQRRWRVARDLVGLGVVVTVATLANPYGADLLHATLLTLQSPLNDHYISEWLPPTLGDAPHIFVYALLMFALPMVRVQGLTLPDKMLAVFWGVMTLQSIRYLGIWLVFMTPLIAVGLEALPERYSAWRRKQEEYARDLARPRAVWVTGGACVLFAGLLCVPAVRHGLVAPVAPDPALIPVVEVAYLLEHHRGERLFSHYGYGGYIAYASSGALPIMMDGRANTVYSHAVTKDFLQVDQFREDWSAVLTRYGVRVVLLPRYADAKTKTPYHGQWYMTQAGWKPVFSGEVATVYTHP